MPRRSRLSLAVFAGGDFAFNLYWQSMMLYLLFYYTEALHLPIATAALCYSLASIWDGVASLAIGIWVDRRGAALHRRFLVGGAVPLGAAFVFTYIAPPAPGAWAVAWIFAGQILLRTLYALVNIPYLAMSARVSIHSADRALVAGGRMLAGTLAAVVVAVGTVPVGTWLSGSSGAPAYSSAAALFAVVGAAVLVGVGLAYREDDVPRAIKTVPLARTMLLAWRNRAFVTLGAAMTAMIVAVSMLDKSVLYYFKYSLGDESAGRLALGAMMAVSAVAVPVWFLASRRIGIRALWFAAIALFMAALATFIAIDLETPVSVQVFLIVTQVASVGLNFALWAMLPDTIEYGQRRHGVRTEAILYGYVALLQRLAIGLSTAVMGFSLGGSALGSPGGSSGGLRLTIALLPLGFLALSALLMLFNPLRRGSHETILRELREEEESRRDKVEAAAHAVGLG
ncbi:MAG: MFS transporter [Sphingomonadales bacterium]|nr:MFS transporter [Sphingomonadales bacterium]MDE2569189.1 MFS transporter [Sphingomonadales bacterium]